MKILVVDDDLDNAMSMSELFELEGHQVRTAFSGQEAIDACLSDQFDLAFMDVMMPGKNGVESFIEIRRLRPDAKVFMMTGYSVEELLAQAVREGAMGYLEKPFDPNEVLKLIANVGKGGLLVALPAASQREVGDVIESTLKSHGQSCARINSEAAEALSYANDHVLILDAPMPLIDAVSSYRAMRQAGCLNTTIIVPQSGKMPADVEAVLRDVRVTGILNKPFDPLELINKLPELAA